MDELNVRYVLSFINKDGCRVLVNPMQGRYTYATQEEARKRLGNLLSANTEDQLKNVFGPQSIGTFKVSAVECWPGHNDPKSMWPLNS